MHQPYIPLTIAHWQDVVQSSHERLGQEPAAEQTLMSKHILKGSLGRVSQLWQHPLACVSLNISATSLRNCSHWKQNTRQSYIPVADVGRQRRTNKGGDRLRHKSKQGMMVASKMEAKLSRRKCIQSTERVLLPLNANITSLCFQCPRATFNDCISATTQQGPEALWGHFLMHTERGLKIKQLGKCQSGVCQYNIYRCVFIWKLRRRDNKGKRFSLKSLDEGLVFVLFKSSLAFFFY